MAEVVAFEQRERRPPAVVSCDFRLDDTTYALEMTLRNDASDVVAVLSFGLESKPRDFDLSLLAEAWARWRELSPLAS